MGLDMRPMGKPKPGFEERYKQIFRIIEGKEKQEPDSNGKLATRDELMEEWFSNIIPSYETIKAPRVGRDKEADEWVKNKYSETDQSLSESEFLNKLEGYYVIELGKEKDGLPMYMSFNQDENVFRGQFLNDCIDLIGEELVNEAWGTKLAEETLDYGQRLMAVADEIAKENNLQYLKDERLPPDTDQDSMESKLHIVYSLARWLIFYGENGHGYEADF